MRSIAFFALATTGELRDTVVRIQRKNEDRTYLAEVIASFLRLLYCWVSVKIPAAVANSSNKRTRPEELSMVTWCFGPSDARSVIRSNDKRAASGCGMVERIRANIRFHSVAELGLVKQEPINEVIIAYLIISLCFSMIKMTPDTTCSPTELATEDGRPESKSNETYTWSRKVGYIDISYVPSFSATHTSWARIRHKRKRLTTALSISSALYCVDVVSSADKCSKTMGLFNIITRSKTSPVMTYHKSCIYWGAWQDKLTIVSSRKTDAGSYGNVCEFWNVPMSSDSCFNRATVLSCANASNARTAAVMASRLSFLWMISEEYCTKHIDVHNLTVKLIQSAWCNAINSAKCILYVSLRRFWDDVLAAGRIRCHQVWRQCREQATIASGRLTVWLVASKRNHGYTAQEVFRLKHPLWKQRM